MKPLRNEIKNHSSPEGDCESHQEQDESVFSDENEVEDFCRELDVEMDLVLSNMEHVLDSSQIIEATGSATATDTDLVNKPLSLF